VGYLTHFEIGIGKVVQLAGFRKKYLPMSQLKSSLPIHLKVKAIKLRAKYLQNAGRKV
jgi:hypothetical protein